MKILDDMPCLAQGWGILREEEVQMLKKIITFLGSFLAAASGSQLTVWAQEAETVAEGGSALPVPLWLCIPFAHSGRP